MNKKIALLHPFTPNAAGVIESAVPVYHSQPHVKALMALATKTGYQCSMEYFTNKWVSYSKTNGILKWNFYPVTIQLNGNHRKWLKQKSNTCFKHYTENPPDVTIINMSAHASLFCYELSKILKQQNRPYIAMLGGQHYSDFPWIKDYYQNAHHLIVHTQRQKREMEQMELFKNTEIRVMPLGVEYAIFTPAEKKSAYTNNPQLLFVGRIGRNKQVHLCLETLSYMQKNGFEEATLTIIGPEVDDLYMAELKQTIQRLELTNHVTIYDQIPHAELITHYQQADLLLFPSISESFGMVMIESMSCETPVAALTGSGGPEEVIHHGVDGILTTAEEYPVVVCDLIKNHTLIKEMGINARKKINKEYSIEVTEKVLLHSIEQAIRSAE